jgi:hypothetical protein
VNRETGLVDKWEYILKGGPGPATPFLWKSWVRYGKILLSGDRVNPKDGTRIYFPVLDAPAAVADAVFASREPAPTK